MIYSLGRTCVDYMQILNFTGGIEHLQVSLSAGSSGTYHMQVPKNNCMLLLVSVSVSLNLSVFKKPTSYLYKLSSVLVE